MPRVKKQPVLAIDLGGTKIAAGLVSADGKLISQGYCLALANEGPEAVIKRLLSLANQTLGQAGLKTSQIAAVVIAAAGVLDTNKGLVTVSVNLPGWSDIPLQDIVRRKLGLKTYLINDANAAALGEYCFATSRNIKNLVYIAVGTGIGGGIVTEGQLRMGADGCAGEIGHMVIKSNGPLCNCGNKGCLEALASGTAMAKEAVRRLRHGEKSSLNNMAKGRLENITAKMIGEAARGGDYLAGDVVNRAAYYLGIGMVNLVNIFNPERIVVGGSVARIGNLLLNPARKVVGERAFFLPAHTVRIVRAKLGDNSAIIGAALFAFQEIKSESR